MDDLVTRLDRSRPPLPAKRMLSARDYARNGERQGLRLIRDVPIVEARDALKSEAAGG